jgi:transcriptional regulator with XRE-family HTH domain
MFHHRFVLRSNLQRAVRYLRMRRNWRQVDLALRAGVSREAVSRIERGEMNGMALATIGRVTTALGALVDIRVRWEGEQLDRLIDAAHASVQQRTAEMLRKVGWLVRVEVSFNHYGDRGRVDILAFQSLDGCLLVIEVKTGLGDIQDVLGRLDTKARLGATIAPSVGWDGVRRVVPVLVFLDTRSTRRILAAHEALFRRYSLRGRQALSWIRRPREPAPSGLLWFVNLPDSHGVTITRGRRVRTVKSGH